MPPRASAPAKDASPLRVVQAAVQTRQFDPAYYLHGDDDYLKEGAIRDLLDAALDPGTRDFNYELRQGADLDAETLGSLLGTPPMLAERRAVVVRDVGALKKAARTQLDRYLQRPASDTLLLLVSPAGAKVDAMLASHTTSLNFEPLSPERVRRWIAHHASSALNVSIAEDAIQLLQQAVGNDLHLLAGELDKCASFVLGARTTHGVVGGTDRSVMIDADAVSAVVGVKRGETVTDLLDAVAQQDARSAIHLVPHVLAQPKVNAVQVVMMLTTQALALSFGRARRDAGVPVGKLPSEYFAFLKETGGYPGRPWGEAASAWTKVIDHWSAASCERALVHLLDADMALKDTTVSNAEQTMTSLILRLCAVRTRKAA